MAPGGFNGLRGEQCVKDGDNAPVLVGVARSHVDGGIDGLGDRLGACHAVYSA